MQCNLLSWFFFACLSVCDHCLCLLRPNLRLISLFGIGSVAMMLLVKVCSKSNSAFFFLWSTNSGPVATRWLCQLGSITVVCLRLDLVYWFGGRKLLICKLQIEWEPLAARDCRLMLSVFLVLATSIEFDCSSSQAEKTVVLMLLRLVVILSGIRKVPDKKQKVFALLRAWRPRILASRLASLPTFSMQIR